MRVIERYVCTKMQNMYRFDKYANQLVLLRSSYNGTKILFAVYHLREADGARAERSAIGQGEYDPALDIDRYVVDCGCRKGEIDRCAVFDAIRRAIETDGVKPIRVKNDGLEVKRSSLIRGGDGYMGVIGHVFDEEFNFLPDNDSLRKVCESCKCRCDCPDCNADQVEVVVRDVSACGFHKIVHVVIIAFMWTIAIIFGVIGVSGLTFSIQRYLFENWR